MRPNGVPRRPHRRGSRKIGHQSYRRGRPFTVEIREVSTGPGQKPKHLEAKTRNAGHEQAAARAVAWVKTLARRHILSNSHGYEFGRTASQSPREGIGAEIARALSNARRSSVW